MNSETLGNFCAGACTLLFLAMKSAGATAPIDKGLCRGGEQVVFSCFVAAKTASVCASDHVSKESGYMQYRFGTTAHADMLYPKSRDLAHRHFFISSVTYAGGGETHLRFSVGQYDYVIYDRTLRENRDSEGKRTPNFESGIVVKKGGTKIKNIRCVDDNFSGIRPVAYEVLQEERYEDLKLR